MVISLERRRVISQPLKEENADTKTPDSSHASHAAFRYFPRLPLELQRAIWRESLPRRVVTFPPELRHVRLDGQTNTETCHTPHTLLLRRTSPVPTVAQVCREARVVALEHGALSHVEKMRLSRCTFPPISLWFDGSRDIMLPSGPLAEICPIKAPAYLPRAGTVAFPLSRTRGSRHSAFKHLHVDCSCFSGRLSTVIIVRHVKIHPSRRSILESSFSGEEPVILVDLHDRKKLLELCKIDESKGIVPSQPRIDRMVEEIQTDDCPGKDNFGSGFSRLLRMIIEDNWLDHNIYTAPKDEDHQRDPSIYPADANSTFERYDRAHWWVQKTLQKLVPFELKIAVELCKPDSGYY